MLQTSEHTYIQVHHCSSHVHLHAHTNLFTFYWLLLRPEVNWFNTSSCWDSSKSSSELSMTTTSTTALIPRSCSEHRDEQQRQWQEIVFRQVQCVCHSVPPPGRATDCTPLSSQGSVVSICTQTGSDRIHLQLLLLFFSSPHFAPVKSVQYSDARQYLIHNIAHTNKTKQSVWHCNQELISVLLNSMWTHTCTFRIFHV